MLDNNNNLHGGRIATNGIPSPVNSICKIDAEDMELSNEALYSSGDCDEESDSNSSRSAILSSRLKAESADLTADSENDPNFLISSSPPLVSRRAR